MARNETPSTTRAARTLRWRWMLAALLAGLTLGGGPAVTAAEPTQWLTGMALARQLEQPVGAGWSGVPLSDALASLSTLVGQRRRLAVMLDRRVDPGQKLDLELRNVSLREALSQIAERCDLEVIMLGPVAYFGPRQSTQWLRTLAELRREDVRKLPVRQQRAFTRLRPWHWDDLATPRELLAGLAEETGVAVRGQQLVPHDLWPEVGLPPLELADRLTLFGAAFDLTFHIAPDGRSVELVPIEPPVFLQRSYPIRVSDRGLSSRLAALVPRATIGIENGRVIVRGRFEDHEIVADVLQGKSVRPVQRPRSKTPSGEKVFTLTVKQQRVGSVIRQVCRQLDLDLRFDQGALDAAGVSLETVVSFHVEGVTIDRLLQAALEPAGMTFSRQGEAVEVRPASRRP